MIVMLDTSEDLKVCEEEIGCTVEQLLTPLTRFNRQQQDAMFCIDNGAFSKFNAEGYRALLSLLHEVSSEADPAGTLRELRQAQDTCKALETRVVELEEPWISVEEGLPNPSEWVLAWLYLPKNPPASGHVLAQFAGCEGDEPEDYGEYRRTVGCWWANGRYYGKGHVTYWKKLPKPPVSRLKEERKA